MLELPDQVRQPAPLALLRHRVAAELTGAGIGIPDGILDRIFEPFFAEKHFDEKTGVESADRLRHR